MKALKTSFVLAVALVVFGLFPAAAQSVSHLRMSSVTRFSDGTIQLEIRGDPGTTFTIETTPDLQFWSAFPGWQFRDWGLIEFVLQVYTLDAEGIAIVVDADARGLLTRFYRSRRFP